MDLKLTDFEFHFAAFLKVFKNFSVKNSQNTHKLKKSSKSKSEFQKKIFRKFFTENSLEGISK